MSATGRTLVYVGSYTEKLFFVDGKGEGIYLFALDPSDGSLSPLGVTTGVQSPSLLAIAPSGRYLYSVNETDRADGRPQGAVSAFAIDPATGALEFLNRQPSHGQFPCFVTIDATGRFVVVANHENGSLACYPVESDGRLGDATAAIQHEGSSVHPQHQRGPHVHSVNFDPTNHYLLVCDKGIDRVLVYRLDHASGRLTLNDPAGAVSRPGAAPRHLAFHPSGRYAFVINEIGSTMTAYAFDSESGALRETDTQPTLPADYSGRNATADVHVHPTGRFVYGSNRGHDSLAVLAFDEASGRLSPRGHVSTQGAVPRAFKLDPSGRLLLAANQNSDSVVAFHVDPDDGSLTPTGAVTRTPTPVCIRFLVG